MAETRLGELLEEIAEEHGYIQKDIKIKPITSGGANYTSKLFLSTISAPKKESIHLFAKVCNLSEEIRPEFAEGKMYDNEFLFYHHIIKVYSALENKHCVPNKHKLRVPKYFKSNSEYLEEVLVLEDLAVQGFMPYNRMESISWEYAIAAVNQLSKLHALSIAFYKEKPKEFKEFSIQFPLLFSDSGTVLKEMMYIKTTNVSIEAIREENRCKVKNYLKKDRFNEFIECYKPKNLPILAHSDYRQSNLLHRIDKDGKFEVVPVDFQTMSLGNPAADLMYFIYTGSDSRFRKDHYEDLVEYYYTELTAALNRLDIAIDEIYPRKKFEADLKSIEMFGLFLALMFLPVITVESEDAPNMGEDCKIGEYSVTPSKYLDHRLNGVIDEYVAKGLL